MSDNAHEEAARLYAEALDRRATGNPTGAVVRFLQCIAIYEERGELRPLAAVYLQLAEMHRDLYDLPEAHRWYERARATHDALADPAAACRCGIEIARIRILDGDYLGAAALLAVEAETARQLGDPCLGAVADVRLGEALCLTGELGAGRARLEAGHAVLRAANAPEADAAAAILDRWSTGQADRPISPRPSR